MLRPERGSLGGALLPTTPSDTCGLGEGTPASGAPLHPGWSWVGGRIELPSPRLPELLIHSCISFHLANSMGDCQLSAPTKFNLQAVLCPLSTCLLSKTLMKRLIRLVYLSPTWVEQLRPSTQPPPRCPLQSRSGALATLSAPKQIKSH